MDFNQIYSQIFQQAGLKPVSQIPEFNGKLSYDIACKNTLIRERYSGSIGNKQALYLLELILKDHNIEYTIDQFVKDSPIGIIKYKNINVDFKFTNSKKFILIGAHHDTKFLPTLKQFEGANDGASGVGLILGLILFLKENNISFPVNLKFVLFDGEECFYQYEDRDGISGSSYTAQKYGKDCISMILLDMIGGKDLKIQFPKNSNEELIGIVKQVSSQEQKRFINFQTGKRIIDDTVPFEKINIPTINFIDFSYQFWHTNQDTIDKLSQNSFSIVGNVVLKLLKNLALHTFEI